MPRGPMEAPQEYKLYEPACCTVAGKNDSCGCVGGMHACRHDERQTCAATHLRVAPLAHRGEEHGVLAGAQET